MRVTAIPHQGTAVPAIVPGILAVGALYGAITVLGFALVAVALFRACQGFSDAADASAGKVFDQQARSVRNTRSPNDGRGSCVVVPFPLRGTFR